MEKDSKTEKSKTLSKVVSRGVTKIRGNQKETIRGTRTLEILVRDKQDQR